MSLGAAIMARAGSPEAAAQSRSPSSFIGSSIATYSVSPCPRTTRT
jgi:hypothetical protein